MQRMNKAVFLDRDGTVIVDRGYLENPDDVDLLPGAADAMLRLRKAGFSLVLITNQSGIGRGYFSQATVERQHKRLAALLAQAGVTLDDIRVCPHAPGENCECRKPSPKLLQDAADKLQVNLARSFMIGDKPSDIAAGRNAGCRTVLVGPRKDETSEFHAPDLSRAADVIIEVDVKEIQVC